MTDEPTMDDLVEAEGEGVDVENEAVIPVDLDQEYPACEGPDCEA